MGITREEKLLNSIANGVYSGVQPVTREEQYLAYIAGESYEKPENPITRKELYLDKIPQGGSGGGGVTIRNQNKTITANGVYRADEGYTGLGTVTVAVVSKLPQVIDKTVTELTAEDLQGATEIGEYAFRSCANLTNVVIPEGVTKIGTYSFSLCNELRSVILPSTVKTIGSRAFSSDANLKNITVKATTPPTLETYALQGVPSDCVITVLVGCGDVYKNATNWSARADYIVEGDV